jgi:hypothetical protein
MRRPRLREYAYFELAIYVAMPVVDLTAIGIAIVFNVTSPFRVRR